MDDLSIHELVGSFPIVSDFLIPPKKRFRRAAHLQQERMQQIYQLFWLDFQLYGRGSCATFAIDLLLRPYSGTTRSRTSRAIFQ